MWHGSLLHKFVTSSLLSSPAELPGLLASCWALNQCDMPDPTQSAPCIWERTAKHSHSCPVSGGIKVGKGPDAISHFGALSTPRDRGLGFGVELGPRRGLNPDAAAGKAECLCLNSPLFNLWGQAPCCCWCEGWIIAGYVLCLWRRW